MKKSKIFFISVIVGIILSILLFGLFDFMQIVNPTNLSKNINRTLIYKKKLASQTNGRKILFISGSSSFLGVSAKQIQMSTNIPTVNMAETIQLGIKYMLYYCRAYLKPGDTILLLFEYETYNGEIEGIFSNYLACYDREYLYHLPARQISDIALKLFAGGCVRLIGMGRKDKLAQKLSVNMYGDSTNNQRSAITPEMATTVSSISPLGGLMVPFNRDSDVWDALSEFIEWAHKNNIMVLASWPNTIYHKEYDEGQAQKNIAQISTFYEKHGVPVLGTAREFMYPADYFFDSAYHLHDQSVPIRTEQLLKYIKKEIKP